MSPILVGADLHRSFGLVTHEARVAAHADRTVLLRDGVDALRAAADTAARAGVVVP